MKQDLNLTKLIESLGCGITIAPYPNFVWVVYGPNGESIGDPFNSYRSMINELMGSDIGVVVKQEYQDEREMSWTHENLDNWAFDNLERVALEMNYRIERKSR